MDERPFYTHSFEEAKRNDELEKYKLSHGANADCKTAIEKAIAANFDGMRLNADTAKTVISEFGYDRVRFVLANTIQQKDWDGRFSHDNKAWAKDTFVPEDMVFQSDRRLYFVVESHPAVLDGFVNQFRRAYKELDLWDKAQVNDPQGMDFTGKIMVLHPNILNEQHKTRDEQLFYCTGGFGCSPNKTGRKVMGEFLTDSEQTHFYRQDFLGEAKAELLPAWAKEKFAQKQEDKAEKPSIRKQLETTPKSSLQKAAEIKKPKDKEVR